MWNETCVGEEMLSILLYNKNRSGTGQFRKEISETEWVKECGMWEET